MSKLPHTRLQLQSYIGRSRTGRDGLPDINTLSVLHSTILSIRDRLPASQQWKIIALDNLYNDIVRLSVTRTNDNLLLMKLQQLKGLLNIYSRVSMNVRKSIRKSRGKSISKSRGKSISKSRGKSRKQP